MAEPPAQPQQPRSPRSTNSAHPKPDNVQNDTD